MKKGIVPRRNNLTNREFLTITREKAPEIARELAPISHAADKVVYGQRSLSAGDIAILFEKAQILEEMEVEDK